MSEWEEEHPKTHLLSEVEIGKNYAMVITTNSGLYRYKIGDTISFTSTDPYKIKITGRIKQFINVFGEEVMVSNTDQGSGRHLCIFWSNGKGIYGCPYISPKHK